MSLFRRLLERRSIASAEPALPASAQLIAIQSPSETLPERPFDLWLIVAMLGLLAIGTVAIYSSTAADGLTRYSDAYYYLERQLVFVTLGGVAMWVASRLDYRLLQRFTYPLLMMSLGLLAVALLTPARNGASRWIPLGPFTFQPVEIAKLALIT